MGGTVHTIGYRNVIIDSTVVPGYSILTANNIGPWTEIEEVLATLKDVTEKS